MSEPRRLHHAAWLANTLDSLREVLLPAVAIFLLGGPGLGSGVFIGGAAALVSGFFGWLKWRHTQYWIDDAGLQYLEGVLTPDQKTIPISRISALDEVRGPAQRLFGVTAVHVQTAGGSAEGEIVLTAVTRAEAQELRERLRRSGEAAAAAPPDEVTWRLSAGRLLVAAVTGPQLGVVVPLVAGAVATLVQFGEGDLEEIVRRLPRDAGGWETLAVYAAGAVIALALLGAVVSFGGFTVTRAGRRLRIRRGFVVRRAASVEVGRVAAIRVVEGIVRRPLGFCTVRMEVSGYAREPAAAQTLVPLVRRRELAPLLERLLPELSLPVAVPGRPPARALSPHLVAPVAGLAALAAAGAAAAVGLGAPAAAWTAPVAGALLGAVVGFARWRAAGWWLDEGQVALRRHLLLSRNTTIAGTARLQDVGTSQSALQRRRRLRSVGLAVASGHRARVTHLDASAADGLLAALRARCVPAAVARQPPPAPAPD